VINFELDLDQLPLVNDELDVLGQMVNLSNQAIIELGCGNARLSRSLLERYPNCKVTGLEVDAIQHAKNIFQPQHGIEFVEAGAQNVPFPDGTFDLALMLKSLHHVPIHLMDQGLEEVARVLRTGSLFYVSEPIYSGALNDIVRLYNDEGIVRSAAQMALDRALAKHLDWTQVEERRFAQPVHYSSFDEFEKRMLYPSFADHSIDVQMLLRIQEAFTPHLTKDGASFVRPMHVRLLRKVS